MTPPVFGCNAPCYMTDGTPTYESGMRPMRNTSGCKHKKRRIPRQLFCADAVHIFLHRLVMGFLTTPSTHPCELTTYYKLFFIKTQVNYINKSLVKYLKSWNIITIVIPGLDPGIQVKANKKEI